MFGWIKNVLGPKPRTADPYERFVLDFVEACRRKSMLPKSYDPKARAFLFDRSDDTEMQFHLDNVFRAWVAEDSRREEVISRFVQSIAETISNPALVAEELPRQLMPGIRSHAQISNVMIHNWVSGAPVDDAHVTAFLPFLGDLVACAMRDMSHSMSQMTHANLAHVALPLEQAMQIAMTNLRSKLPAPAFEPLGDGLFGCNNLQDHQSALLLLTPGKDYALPPLQGEPIALAPSRNLFYVTGSRNTAGLNKLLDLAGNAGQRAHFCSSTMLRWDGERWTEFHFDDGDVRAVRQREISQGQLAADYHSQKQLLDRYHEKCGLDIFVAQLMHFRKKQSPDTISVAVSASGTTGTLLPCADRLSFIKQIVDPANGLADKTPSDTVQVAWADAMDIAGHLFEPVAHVYPPRLRALGFPEGDAWARLKAAADR